MAKAVGLGAVVCAVLIGAAEAATQAECTAAVRDAQRASINSIILRNEKQKSMRFSQLLARASAMGQRGDYEGCLQQVRNARGGYGIPK